MDGNDKLMSLPILVVAKDSEFYQQERIGWSWYGSELMRIDTMQEAIEKLNKEQFLFAIISAATVNYLPLLNIMSEVSSTPIILGAYEYSVREQVEALHNGASAYALFQHNTEDNVLSALALLNNYNKRGNRAKKLPRASTSGNLIMFYDRYQVFCNDVEISLTPIEFKFLHYILSNPNVKLTFRQFSRWVWRDGCDDVSHNAIWQHINKLKKKLKKAKFNGGDIENIRGIGYRFTPQYPNNT